VIALSSLHTAVSIFLTLLIFFAGRDAAFGSCAHASARAVGVHEEFLITEITASGAIQSVSGLGFEAEYFYHPQKRTLETVPYTKDGDTTPLLQSLRKYDPANRLTRITAHVNDAGVQKPLDHHAYDYEALDRIRKHTGITGSVGTTATTPPAR
jgi:hypothetical protein